MLIELHTRNAVNNVECRDGVVDLVGGRGTRGLIEDELCDFSHLSDDAGL